MELITLCGLVIVVFGLWVEFELAVKRVVKMIRSYKAVQHPVCMSRMPICLAKLSHYRESA